MHTGEIALSLAAVLIISLLASSQLHAAEAAKPVLLKVTAKTLTNAGNSVQITAANPPNGSYVYGFYVLVVGQEIGKTKAPAGWTVSKPVEGAVLFWTSTAPLAPGNQLSFHVTTSKVIKLIIWAAADSSDQPVDGGAKSVEQRKGVTQVISDELYGFSVTLPGQWGSSTELSDQYGDAIMTFYTDVDYRVNDSNYAFTSLNIKAEDMGGLSLINYVKAAKDGVRAMFAGSDMVILKEGPAKVKDKSAYYLEYAIKAGKGIKIKQTIVANGNTAYIFTYGSTASTYAKYLKEADSIVASFKLHGQSIPVKSDNPQA